MNNRSKNSLVVALSILGALIWVSASFAQSDGPVGPFRINSANIEKWDVDLQRYENHLFRGMNWSAYPVGGVGTFPGEYGFVCGWANGENICPAGYRLHDLESIVPIMHRDFPLISLIGANSIRVFTRVDSMITPGSSPLLALADANDLDVFAHYPVETVDFTDANQRAFFINDFVAYVAAVEGDVNSHRVAAYVFGNENNIRWCTECNQTAQANAFYSMLGLLVSNATTAFPNILVTTSPADIADIQNYDNLILSSNFFWSTNIYRGFSFNNSNSNLFLDLLAATSRPVVITEFGVDSFDNSTGTFNEENQATTLANLWDEIDHDYNNNGRVSGGFIFEWSDEWWKAGGQWNSTSMTQELQNAGFPNPNTPDRFSNEESYGVVGIVPNRITHFDDLFGKQAGIDLYLGNIW